MMLQNYYRSKLSYVDQRAYDDLCKGISLHRKDIQTSYPTDFARVLRAVNYDHPEFFYVNWMDSIRLTSLGCFSSIHLSYIYSDVEILKIQDRINEISRSISGISDYGKALGVHDWFVKNIVYDHKGLRQMIRSPGMFSAAGPIIHGKAVCEGVSKLACCLLRAKRVDCAVIPGNSADGTPHAWIAHKSDGNIVYSDITYDMGICHVGSMISHRYFNLSREKMSKDHIFECF